MNLERLEYPSINEDPTYLKYTSGKFKDVYDEIKQYDVATLKILCKYGQKRVRTSIAVLCPSDIIRITDASDDWEMRHKEILDILIDGPDWEVKYLVGLRGYVDHLDKLASNENRTEIMAMLLNFGRDSDIRKIIDTNPHDIQILITIASLGIEKYLNELISHYNNQVRRAVIENGTIYHADIGSRDTNWLVRSSAYNKYPDRYLHLIKEDIDPVLKATAVPFLTEEECIQWANTDEFIIQDALLKREIPEIILKYSIVSEHINSITKAKARAIKERLELE